MRQGPRFKVPLRRRREGRTDYRARLRLLRPGLTRVVVRKTLANTLVQFVQFDLRGDRVVASAISKELEKLSWPASHGNTPAAYLTGYLAGKRAKAQGIDRAVLDTGMLSPRKGSKVFAALKGIVDAGIEVPHGQEMLPSEERIRGEHIGDHVVKIFEKVKAKLEES